MSTEVSTVSPDRYRSISVSSSLSVMIPSISASRADASASLSLPRVTGFAVRWPEEYSYSVSDSSPISPLTPGDAPATGRYSGATPSPKASWHSASTVSKSARPWSILVMTTARGIPTSAHSSHRSRVTPSMPSVADATNSAQSAARSPARRSPVKSAYPGVSSRLTVTPSTTNGRRVRFTDRFCRSSTSSKSLAVVPSSTRPIRGIAPA